jgi:plasmid stability protein
MSYRAMLNHRSFDAEIIKIMNDAYDQAFEQFPDANEKIVARTILTAALDGERDVTRLSQFALLSLFDGEE